MADRNVSTAIVYQPTEGEGNRNVSTAIVYQPTEGEGDRNVSTAIVYQPTEGEGDRNVSAGFVYQPTIGEGSRNVSTGFIYQPTIVDGERITSAAFIYFVVVPNLFPATVAGNVLVWYQGADLTPYLHESSIQAVTQAINVTNFDSSTEKVISGLPGFSVQLAGEWSPELDSILGPDAIRSLDILRDLWIELGIVVYEWFGTRMLGAFVSNYRIESAPTAPIMWSAELTCSGPPRGALDAPRAVVLASSLDALVFNLRVGSIDNPPPADWETLGFNDSAWATASTTSFPPALPGTISVRFGSGSPGDGAQQLLRHHFRVNVGTQRIRALHLQMNIEDHLHDVYLNGVRVGGDIFGPAFDTGFNVLDVVIDPDVLIDGDNVLAAHYANETGFAIGLSYLVTINA